MDANKIDSHSYPSTALGDLPTAWWEKGMGMSRLIPNNASAVEARGPEGRSRLPQTVMCDGLR